MISRCRRDRVLTGALVALLLAYALVPLDPAVLQVWYIGLATLAVLVGFHGVRARRPAHPRGWLLTLSGFSGWVVGDVMWPPSSTRASSQPASRW